MSDNKISNTREKLHPELCVLFAILQGNQKIINGAFIVSPTPGVSCFGEYKYPKTEINKDRIFNSGMFDGVIIEHTLKDDLAGISLRLLKVEVDITSPLGIKQVVVLKAGLAMGKSAGAEKTDSVALGGEYQFFYKTTLL